MIVTVDSSHYVYRRDGTCSFHPGPNTKPLGTWVTGPAGSLEFRCYNPAMMGFRGAGPGRSVFVAVFVVGMLAAGLYAAQSSTKPTGAISVQQILDKNLAAMGGLEKLGETKTLEVGGSFGLNPYHSSGDFRFIFKAPTSDLFRLDYVSHGQTMTILHNGKLFTKQSGGKAFAMNGITDGVMEEAWRHLIEPNVGGYLSVTLTGLAQTQGKWAYALRFVPLKGDSHIRYYDAESFLVTQIEMVQRLKSTDGGADSGYKVYVEFEDCRPTDGLRFPRLLTGASEQGNLEFRVTSVRTNVPVDDALFQ